MQTRLTCTRSLACDMGHRVYGHENKCNHMHGHRFTFLITATAPHQDSVGRIIDFSVLKQKIGSWIDREWDHGFVLWEKDPALPFMRQMPVREHELQKLYVMPYNPTAENLAKYLLEDICPKLLKGTGVTVVAVEVQETPNGKAKATMCGEPWDEHNHHMEHG